MCRFALVFEDAHSPSLWLLPYGRKPYHNSRIGAVGGLKVGSKPLLGPNRVVTTNLFNPNRLF